jgi:tetratricopeptide (TPR) repeat protein
MKNFLKAEALAAVRAGNFRLGIVKYREYLDLAPNAQDDDAWAALGGAHRRAGEIDEAIQCYQKAYELNSSSTYALVNLVSLRAARNDPADSEQQARDVQKAIKLCRETIESGKATFWNWYDLATLHLIGGKTREAAEFFHYAVALTPETAKENFRSVLSNLEFLRTHNPAIAGLDDTIALVKSHAT